MKRILWLALAVLLPVCARADLRPPSSLTTFSVVQGTATTFFASTATITNMVGTTTNNSAAVGNVGEFKSSTTLSAAAIASGGNGVLGDVASILLTPGDWDISGAATANLNGATTTAWDAYILTVAGNSSSGFDATNTGVGLPPTAAAGVTITIPRIRASLSANTTYYLKSDFTLGAGNCKTYGTINARRVR